MGDVIVKRRELRIPVSYGHLAAVAWGDDSPPSDDGGQLRVLALHGWQDNALSFQPLVDALFQRPPSHNLNVVALDFPGHGLSSHLGAGALYTHLHLVSSVLRAAQHLRWMDDDGEIGGKGFVLLGHSMGATVAVLFAAFFPDAVRGLVTLDVLLPSRPLLLKRFIQDAGFANVFEAMPNILRTQALLEERKYQQNHRSSSTSGRMTSWTEALEKFAASRHLDASDVAVRAMASRAISVHPTSGAVHFARDPRVAALGLLSFEATADVEGVLDRLEKHFHHAPWLAILATREGDDRVTPKVRAAAAAAAEKEKELVLGSALRRFRRLQVVRMRGSHYVHLERACAVAEHVTRMLLLLLLSLEGEKPNTTSKL